MTFVKNLASVVLIAAIAAVLYNNFSGRGIPWFAKINTEGPRPRLVVSSSVAAINYLELPEARARYEAGVAFLDARTEEEYKVGHVSGAINVPAALEPEEISAAIPSQAKDAELVIYCDGEECGASTTLAGKLQRMGYSKVHVFFGGWTVWANAKCRRQLRAGQVS
jgi:rhodanese-related sulfurtransferase